MCKGCNMDRTMKQNKIFIWLDLWLDTYLSDSNDKADVWVNYSESYRTVYNMLVPYNSREWFRVERLVDFPICVALKANENTFAFNYRRSRCDSMWGLKHVLYIFVYVVMHLLWATFVNIPLYAETDPAKSYAQIRILWNRSTADALGSIERQVMQL